MDTEDTNKNKLVLKDFLPYRLSILSNRISSAISGYYGERYSLSVSDWRTMMILSEEPDISAAEVADRAAIDKVAVSRAVKNLLGLQYIERHFSPNDRRRSVLKLSPLGQEIYEKVVPSALAYEVALLDGLTEQEQLFLDRIINKLDDIQHKTILSHRDSK